MHTRGGYLPWTDSKGGCSLLKNKMNDGTLHLTIIFSYQLQIRTMPYSGIKASGSIEVSEYVIHTQCNILIYLQFQTCISISWLELFFNSLKVQPIFKFDLCVFGDIWYMLSSLEDVWLELRLQFERRLQKTSLEPQSYRPHITTTRWTTPRRAEDKHTRWPGRNLEGGAFACYVITQLQAYKADNSELINSRVPGATLLTSRCLGQGHNMEVSSPLSNSE